jgi:hypothetical protein
LSGLKTYSVLPSELTRIVPRSLTLSLEIVVDGPLDPLDAEVVAVP